MPIQGNRNYSNRGNSKITKLVDVIVMSERCMIRCKTVFTDTKKIDVLWNEKLRTKKNALNSIMGQIVILTTLFFHAINIFQMSF